MSATAAGAAKRTEMPAPPGAAEAPLRASVGLRWTLWASLIGLVAGLLATLVWLAGRYEASQVQGKLERDTADAVSDVRSELTRDVQSLQALQSGRPTRASWTEQASALLLQHREWVRLEWRDVNLGTIASADSPYRPDAFLRLGRANAQSDVALACTNARRVSGPAYSSSYFQPQPDGLGLELMEMCLPQTTAGQITGYEIATFSLS
jgi:two-component system, LuxR family, sensor histidine kinase DctS